MEARDNIEWVKRRYPELWYCLSDKLDIQGVVNISAGKRDKGLELEIVYVSLLKGDVKYCEFVLATMESVEFRKSLDAMVSRFRTASISQ